MNERNGDDLEYEEDLRNVKPDEMVSAGQKAIPAGKYHAMVKAIAREKGTDGPEGKKPAFAFQYKILHPREHRNRIIWDRLYLTEESLNRRTTVATQLGLTSAEDAGKVTKINWRAAIDMQVVIEVKVDKYTDPDTKATRENNKVVFNGVWAVTHKDVADVPKDAEALQAAAIEMPDAAGSGVFDQAV
jgi:hypothetical protein